MLKIVSIEPTPSPNSMKINLNTALPAGQNQNYKHGDDLDLAPEYIQKLLEIKGVKSIYHVMDFIALDRNPKKAWEDILPEVRNLLGSEEEKEQLDQQNILHSEEDAFGEVKVFIQMFRGIPMQVKLTDGNEERRFGLPELFMNSAMEASPASTNIVTERKWVEQKPRYGSFDEIGEEVVEEIKATYDLKRVERLVELAFDAEPEPVEVKRTKKVTLEMLDHSDWKTRYAALAKMNPSFKDLPVLEKALRDTKASIRRLATAYLGMIEEPEVLPYLYHALKDSSIAVRRTAGDCISDLGFKEAMPEMIASLRDPNKLVRWRAAMFLYEIGDETAIPALKEAIDDPEFEVRMQIKMALGRIEGGEEAMGSVWHQMTEARKVKEKH